MRVSPCRVKAVVASNVALDRFQPQAATHMPVTATHPAAVASVVSNPNCIAANFAYNPPRGDQLVVAADDHDTPRIQHHDAIRLLDRCQPVRDDQHRVCCYSATFAFDDAQRLMNRT